MMIKSRLKRREGRMAFLILVLLFGFLALGASVEASPISSFTGYDFATGVGIDGTVNYAVFTSTNFSQDANGILSSFKPGMLSPSLDLTDPSLYVYVYQIVNDGINATQITSWSIDKPSASDVGAWGYFSGAVFTDAGGNVGANNSLDLNATSVGFFLDSGVNPTLIYKATSSVQASLNIAAGATSSLMVFTSHYGPGWANGAISNGGNFALDPPAGPAVAPVPEPGTLLLLGSGLLGLTGLAGWRRRSEDWKKGKR